jgi:diguanylate cyclase (GGDEF)-like protein
VRDGEGRPTAVMEISRDVTAAKRAEDALRHQATYDTLTNLPNRKFFMDRVQNAIDLEQRYGGRKFAVAFLDLDRFKLINDSLGHSAGDELLVSVAERLKNNSRSSDTVARLGGDEFAILIESITSQEDALTAAERMQRYVSEPYQLGDHEVFTSPSIGIVLGNGSYKSPEEMLRDADNAMYQAKSSGRACCRVFDSAMHRQSFNRLSMEADLRRALEADEFRVHYQPILSLVTGEVVAAEALVRWQHPGRGMVSPSEFIPIAEETGLIVPIGEWVLRTACAQYKSWEEAGHEGLRMAVNFSAKQFQTGNVRDCIARVLDQTGVGAHALNLEITESIAVSPDERVIDMLKGVSAMGSWICLDDFGTGYSSLSTLKHLPISCLKLDRIFIGDIPGNEEATDLCRAIIAMAHVLKLNVVAEGVETVEQLEFLRGVGCDEAQGFLFSRPVVPGDFSMLLGKGRELFQTPSRGA